jgi:hypothetical protein
METITAEILSRNALISASLFPETATSFAITTWATVSWSGAPRVILYDNPQELHPFNTDRMEMVRSRKTIYVRFDLNDYSIPPEAVGRPLTRVAALRGAIRDALEQNTPRASSVAFLLRRHHRSAPPPALDLSRYPEAQALNVCPHELETHDELAHPRDDDSEQ